MPRDIVKDAMAWKGDLNNRKTSASSILSKSIMNKSMKTRSTGNILRTLCQVDHQINVKSCTWTTIEFKKKFTARDPIN